MLVLYLLIFNLNQALRRIYMSDKETKPNVTEEDSFLTDKQAEVIMRGIREEFLSHTKKQHTQECSDPSELVRKIDDGISSFTEQFIKQPLIATKPIEDMVAGLCKDVTHDTKIPLGTGGYIPDARGK